MKLPLRVLHTINSSPQYIFTRSVTNVSTTASNRGPYTNRRPDISLERPREWNRPLPVGVLPAYDHALKIIKKDSDALKLEAQDLRAILEKVEAEPSSDEAAVREMRERLRILEVQSEINLPDIRWKFANGMGDLSKPVYRHLAEQRWRSEGTLDLLMERIHQMNVVPDVVPEFHPSLDLRVTFPEPSRKALSLGGPNTQERRKNQPVEPGVHLLPEQTREPPKLYTTVFHSDTRLYTLLMVDPDVPDQENQGYTTYLHWMQPNVPLSSSASTISVTSSHTPYIPPHPQRGTPYHRYVILLLPQTTPLPIPSVTDEGRLGFNVRTFIEANGLGVGGGGAHMWREVWNEEVSSIYRDTLKTEEPRYGRPPKPNRYAELRNTKRYI